MLPIVLMSVLVSASRGEGAIPSGMIVIPLLSAAIGTFVGAFVAFQLERRDRERRERSRRIERGRQAQLALVSQLVLLLNIREKILEEHRDDPDAWKNMSPSPFFPDPMTVDFPSLGFLLRPEAGTLVHNLVVAQFNFSQAIDALRYRTELLLSAQKRSVEVGEEAAFDAYVEAMLRSATTATFSHFDEAIELIAKRLEELRSTLKRTYPDSAFMAVPEVRLLGDDE